jgi:hypothetical protein
MGLLEWPLGMPLWVEQPLVRFNLLITSFQQLIKLSMKWQSFDIGVGISGVVVG